MRTDNRILQKDTRIAGERTSVILPGNCQKGIFEKAVDLLEKCCPGVEIKENPEAEQMTGAKGPVIVFGNLADNNCVEKMYFDFLCATDKWYPGPGGYEIRTLLDPYGTGFNIIHIGYSDREGLESAVKRFETMVGETIEYASDINPSRLHIPDEYAAHIMNDVLDSKKDEYYYTFRPDSKGYLAYLTGNSDVLKDYEDAMKEMLSMPRHHLMIYNRFTVWRLLEVAGMLSDDIAHEYPMVFWDWAKGDEGLGAIDVHEYQASGIPRNNHGLIPALGIKMICGYMDTYHPGMEGVDELEKKADNVFAPYFDGGWKPVCDGLCHGWWLSQPVMLHYGLLDPQKRYFQNEGALKAAKCALAVTNNMGWLASAGDASYRRQHAGFNLRIAASVYNNSEFKYVNDILPFEYSSCGDYSVMLRQFDKGVEPSKPDTGLMTVIPVDKAVYDVWNREEAKYAVKVTDTPPGCEMEKCFDKISFRAGWDANDEFMLVDGIGGGGHSYADSGAIIDFTAYGVPFLVSEDRLAYVDPENHNMATISRNGKRKPIPAFMSIEESWENEDMAYVRMLSYDNNGMDWTREMYFVPGIGTLVNDHMEAKQEGEFSATVHFRTPGSVMIKEDGYVCIRENEDGENIAFILGALNDDETVQGFMKQNYSHLFRTPPGLENPEFDGLDDRKLFMKRYRVNRPEVTAYKAGKVKSMQKGDEFHFTHFLTVGKENERPGRAKVVPEGVLIEKNGIEKVVKFQKGMEPGMEDGMEQEEVDFDFFSNLEHEGKADIMSFDMDENGYAAGDVAGEIIVFSTDGEVQWKVKEEGPVFALCMDGGFLYAGIGDDKLACYKNGFRIWIRKFERIPTMFPWWELESQRIVTLAASNGLVFAGCGDNHIRCYNRDGEEIWTYYLRAAVPARILVFDIDGDGSDELVVSGGILSAYSQIEVVDMKGGLKYRPTPEIGAGWTSYTSSMKVFERNGTRYIAHGTNRNQNLTLLRYSEGGFEEVFSKSLAGSVTALCESDGIIYAGTSLGFLFAFDTDGLEKWFSSLYEGVRHIEKTENGLFVIQSEGTMCRLTEQGKVITMSMDSMRSIAIRNFEDRLMMIHEKGIYSVMKEAEEDGF